MKKRFALLTVLGALVMTTGCAFLSDLIDASPWPWPAPKPSNYPSSSEPMRGILFTDLLVMKDLDGVRIDNGDLAKMRKKLNTIYGVLDLSVPITATVRQYVIHGRTETEITDAAIQNMWRVYRQGFRLVVTPMNEPSVRSGESGYMGGFGHRPGLQSRDMYTNEQLAKEKAVWANLKKKVEKAGIPIYGAFLCLEPMDSRSVPFLKELGRYIRQDLKWDNIRLFSQGTRSAGWSDPGLRIEASPSCASYNDWCRQGIPNADGMFQMNKESEAAAHMPTMTTCRPEWILYFPTLVSWGGGGAPGKLEDWMLKYIQ